MSAEVSAEILTCYRKILQAIKKTYLALDDAIRQTLVGLDLTQNCPTTRCKAILRTYNRPESRTPAQRLTLCRVNMRCFEENLGWQSTLGYHPSLRRRRLVFFVPQVAKRRNDNLACSPWLIRTICRFLLMEKLERYTILVFQ